MILFFFCKQFKNDKFFSYVVVVTNEIWYNIILILIL